MKPTDETMMEGEEADIPNETSESSPVQEMFDALSDEERGEMMSLCEVWRDSQKEKPMEGEVDISDVMPSEDE